METTVIPTGTVVVGVDGSPSAARALEWAVDHAVRERRQLTVVHGLDPMGAVRFDPAVMDPEVVQRARHADGRAVLGQAHDRALELAPDLAVRQTLWHTDARVALLDLAERAALLVLGSRGRGPVRSLLLGSVSVAVSRHAPCPVVVVRPGHTGVVRHGIAVGMDASERSRPVLEFAYRQAALRDLPLTIVHAATTLGSEVDAAEAVAGFTEKFPEVRARTEVVHQDPAFALARASERMDLVVVGAHHGGLMRGSVTNAVVEHAACPVAVVPLPVAGSAA